MAALYTAGSIFGILPKISSTQSLSMSGLWVANSRTSFTASSTLCGRYTWSFATGTGGAASGTPMPRPARKSDAPGPFVLRCWSRISKPRSRFSPRAITEVTPYCSYWASCASTFSRVYPSALFLPLTTRPTWPCALMRPGMMVCPWASTTRAPCGFFTFAAGPAATILSPFTTTTLFSTAGRPVPSMSRAPSKTVVWDSAAKATDDVTQASASSKAFFMIVSVGGARGASAGKTHSRGWEIEPGVHCCGHERSGCAKFCLDAAAGHGLSCLVHRRAGLEHRHLDARGGRGVADDVAHHPPASRRPARNGIEPAALPVRAAGGRDWRPRRQAEVPAFHADLDDDRRGRPRRRHAPRVDDAVASPLPHLRPRHGRRDEPAGMAGDRPGDRPARGACEGDHTERRRAQRRQGRRTGRRGIHPRRYQPRDRLSAQRRFLRRRHGGAPPLGTGRARERASRRARGFGGSRRAALRAPRARFPRRPRPHRLLRPLGERGVGADAARRPPEPRPRFPRLRVPRRRARNRSRPDGDGAAPRSRSAVGRSTGLDLDRRLRGRRLHPRLRARCGARLSGHGDRRRGMDLDHVELQRRFPDDLGLLGPQPRPRRIRHRLPGRARFRKLPLGIDRITV